MNREQQALRDFIERTQRGLYLHLSQWFLMGLCVGMPTRAPRIFWMNFAGFVAVAVLRLIFKHRLPAIMAQGAKRTRVLLQALIFVTCLHWSLLAVLSLQEGVLHSLREPLLLMVVGLATAGTVVLAIDSVVRVWYPLVAIGPVGIGSVLLEPAPMGVLIGLMDVLVIAYVYGATRSIHGDYWAALDAQYLLEDRAKSLESLSITDGLTRIPNRLFFERYLEQVWGQSALERQPVSVLLVDLDHFKRINDTYGHSVGDDCLKAAAEAMLRGMRRETDRVARWGGEEFVVLLPNTEGEAAEAVAQRLLSAVSATLVPCPGGMVRLSCSIGVATLHPDGRSEPKSLIEDADKALYAAKSQGRNRVVAAAA